VEKWLAWLSTQTSERIPAIRMDFLVNLTPDGKVEVHTLELTEQGFSMLGWKEGPDLAFGSCLDACFS